jgi:hypothetical protein
MECIDARNIAAKQKSEDPGLGLVLIAVVHFNTPSLDVWTFIARTVRAMGREAETAMPVVSDPYERLDQTEKFVPSYNPHKFELNFRGRATTLRAFESGLHRLAGDVLELTDLPF